MTWGVASDKGRPAVGTVVERGLVDVAKVGLIGSTRARNHGFTFEGLDAEKKRVAGEG
jgi:hypothetical protein